MFTKEFFKDRLILLLGLITIVSTLANILLIIVKLDLSQARVVFRHWLINGNSQFYTVSPTYFYSFIVLALIVLVSSWIVSYKIYDSFKPAAYFTFLFAEIVLIANFLIGEALFGL